MSALSDAAKDAVGALSRLVEAASSQGGRAQENGDVRARSRCDLLTERVIGLREMLSVALRDAGVSS
ncbi:hypothetical protein GCM10027159_10990 [Lysobacter terrae]